MYVLAFMNLSFSISIRTRIKGTINRRGILRIFIEIYLLSIKVHGFTMDKIISNADKILQ